jgi:outer membrane protein, heavy metal efflux system
MKKIALLVILIAGVLPAQTSTNLPLSKAVELALQRNPGLLSLEQEIAAAGGRVLQASAWPDAEAGVQWGAVPTGFNLRQADEFAFGLRQGFEWPRKRQLRKAMMQKEKDELRLKLALNRRSVEYQVRRHYHQAQSQQRQIHSIAQAESLLQKWQDLTQKRYLNNSAGYMDMLKCRIERARLAGERLTCEENLTGEMHRLNVIIGASSWQTWQLTDSLRFQPIEHGLDEWMRLLEKGSAVLKLVEIRLDKTKTMISLAHQTARPDLQLGLYSQFLQGQPPYSANDFQGVDKKWFWNAEMSLSFPLWNRSKVRGEIEEAEAYHRQSSLALTAVKVEMTLAAKAAYDRLLTCEKQYRLLQEQLVTETSRQWDAALNLYASQQLDGLNLIDIWRTWQETRMLRDQALLNFQLARLDLEFSGERTLFLGEENEQ